MATPTNISVALVGENRRLRKALKDAEDKALRFELDRAGIERRERDAVELVELRAKVVRYGKYIARYRRVITQLIQSIEKSDKRGTYLTRIKETDSRFIAADLIRANAAREASRLFCYDDRERVGIVCEADARACSLERDYSVDGTPCPEKQHPWRSWLKGWGY